MKRILIAGAAVVAVAGLAAGCSSSSSSPSGSGTSSSPTKSGSMSSMSSSGSTQSGSSTTTGSASDQSITIQGTDGLRFDPAMISARVGTVHIKFVDMGSYPHDIRLTTLKKQSKTVTGDPGSTQTTLTVRFAKAGTYPFICTYHSSAGMKGKFVVKS